MKTIIEYQCEICRRKYDTAQEALDCENDGVADLTTLPAGLMKAYYHNGFVGIFAVPLAKIKFGYDKHWAFTNWWACRVPTLPGDSLGDELCGGDNYKTSPEGLENMKRSCEITKEETKTPEFKRMVKYLKSQNITPSYYNEEGVLIIVK